MLIQEKILTTRLDPNRKSQFFIERFLVPEGLMAIKLLLEAETQDLQCVFIYDSDYNLRMELDHVSKRANIMILDGENSSQHTKSGPILSGEWIIAFEVETDPDLGPGKINYRLEGKPKNKKD